MFFCITGPTGKDRAVYDGNFMKISWVSLQFHNTIRIQKTQQIISQLIFYVCKVHEQNSSLCYKVGNYECPVRQTLQ